MRVNHQQRIAKSQWSPELQGVLVRQEVVVNCGGGGHSSYSKGQHHRSLQGRQGAVSGGQQGDAFPTVMLGTVQRVESGHMSPQIVADGGQGPAECSR